MSPAPGRAPPVSATIAPIDTTKEPLYVLRMQAELELAEAELKAARVKHLYLLAKEQAEAGTRDGSIPTETTPQNGN